MKEYRIVCDRENTFRDGKVEIEKGVLCVDEDGQFDRLVFDTPETATYWLARAKEHYARRDRWGLDKIHQYNFRIQEREVTDWRDEK